MIAIKSTLLERARQLDHDAWSMIYNEYYPRVYAFLVTRVRDSMLAEDLAADVFVNALRAIDSYEERGLGLAAWLFRIAHNRLIDHYRRMGVRLSTSLDELEPENGAGAVHDSPAASPHEEIDLQKALLHLNDEQKQVVHLRFIEGLTSEQVAAVLSKSVGAVKIIQHRALKTLKKVLGPPDP